MLPFRKRVSCCGEVMSQTRSLADVTLLGLVVVPANGENVNRSIVEPVDEPVLLRDAP